MEFNDFLTLEYVSTYAGSVVVTMLMVQLLKELPYIRKISTRYFTFLTAFFNMLMCSILTNNFKVENLYLIFINSMLITFTCTGGFDFATKKINKPIEIKEGEES